MYINASRNQAFQDSLLNPSLFMDISILKRMYTSALLMNLIGSAHKQEFAGGVAKSVQGVSSIFV
jgi:hypothetical protein